jgi:hypothetical protein
MILICSILVSNLPISESVTKISSSANLKIGDEIFNIVDTPGIFDTDDINDEVIEEIACTIQKCTYGVKAILFVLGK